MKKFLGIWLSFVIILVFSTTISEAQPNPDFQQYFTDHTMRIDYTHMGDAEAEFIALDKIYQQGSWAGSTTNLIDDFNQGRYYVKIYDRESGNIIYSKGFDSIFGEYKTTTPASNGILRTYHETALIP